MKSTRASAVPNTIPWLAAVLSAIALSIALPAHADFQRAVAKHAAKDFEGARVEFQQLAELGDAPSQFNLGAMSLRGEGVPKDTATAVGWMLAASENGYEGLAREKIDAARAALSPADAARAQAIVDRYGKAAISAQVLPPEEGAWFGCNLQSPTVVAVPTTSVGASARDGFVIIEFTVGVDGLARDPEIVLSVPEREFDYAAQTMYMKGRYRPAMRDGQPVESRMAAKFSVLVEGGGVLWNVGAFDRIRKGAAAGDPGSQYIIGVASLLDRTLGIDSDEAREMIVKAGQGGIPQAQYWVAREFDAGANCRDATRYWAWLDHAAAAGHPRAQVHLARALLDSPGPTNLTRARDLVRAAAASSDPYAIKHAIALAADPRLPAVEAPLLLDASRRLTPPRLRVDPLEDEAAAFAAAANGKWSDAIALQQRAVKHAEDLEWNTALNQQRLAAYHASQLWSGDLTRVAARDTPAPDVDGKKAKLCYEGENCPKRRPDEKRGELGTRLPK